MARNIAIFSDGTGQRSGVTTEETQTNVFKLYRAARSGPDTAIDAREQFAFYDPGIGTLPPGLTTFGFLWRKLYNLVCQATGLGLTKNIVDCYAAIIQNWRPDDRIFLFGFSRGAYTVRCLAAVLAHCGVPTHGGDGAPLKRDSANARKIAHEAVTKVYQHVSSPRDSAYTGQRDLLAQRFRTKYGSDHGGASNVYPHFIGVFDTVASVGSYGSLALVSGIFLVAAALLVLALTFFFGGWKFWASAVVGATALGLFVAYLKTHLKFAVGLPDTPVCKTVHLNALHMQFYDRRLNTNVGWARHALAIDEHRADFDRVAWGGANDFRKTGPGEPVWLKQVWFAGNHADIGGGYRESESRLSDISLEWMAHEATSVPNGLKVDVAYLQSSPDPSGMQHDECRSSVFKFAKKLLRDINPEAPLHPTAIKRFDCPAVQNFDADAVYRPENLRHHKAVSARYDGDGPPENGVDPRLRPPSLPTNPGEPIAERPIAVPEGHL